MRRAFDDLIARAEADPTVLGLVLSGSHARQMASAYSDFDVYVIVSTKSGQWTQTRRTPELDEIIWTIDELADTSVTWQRYSFRGAQILMDRLQGHIAELVTAQATPTPAESTVWARQALDAYINQIYRAAKSRRDGHKTEAELDERESVSWLLASLFALHGRLRPYNKYLRWELETYPLDAPWDATSFPQRLLDNPISLFPAVERLARERGHGDVIDSWGEELELLR